MKRKDGHQSKPGINQGRDTKKHYLSMNNEKIRQGEDFPGNCSQAQNSPSKNFGSPRKQETFWDKQKSEENSHTREEEERNMSTRVENVNKIRQK